MWVLIRILNLPTVSPELFSREIFSYLASPAFNVNNSIDYQLVSDQKNLSQLLLKREKSKYLPTLSGFYRHEEQTNKPAFNFVVKDVVGANLTIPIFTSGMRNAKVSEAKFDCG